MGVNHGGRYVVVAKQLLNGSDILAALKKVRCERVPERVTASMLSDSGDLYCLLYGSLQSVVKDVVSLGPAGIRIDRSL